MSVCCLDRRANLPKKEVQVFDGQSRLHDVTREGYVIGVLVAEGIGEGGRREEGGVEEGGEGGGEEGWEGLCAWSSLTVGNCLGTCNILERLLNFVSTMGRLYSPLGDLASCG